jgi:hypothetical protein
MSAVRNVVVVSVAAAAGAVLGLGQVAAAELLDITTLGADFGAGAERTQGVQVTLIAWYCAMAVPLAVTLALTVAVAVAGARRGFAGTVATVLAAAAGTLATWPLVAHLSGAALRDDIGPAVVTGVLVGVVAAAAVAAAPVVGRGLAAYAGLLWVAAVASTAFVSGTTVYAGLVQPLGLDFLDRLPVPDLPDELNYHVPAMLPVAVALMLLAGVVGGVAARRTGAWARSVAAGAAGPVLAAALYRLPPKELFLWNESASTIALVVAACCLLVAAATAAVFRTPQRAPAE